MLKSSRQAGSLAKRIIIILIMSVLLLSAAACNRKGPPKSGILTDDYELTIEGAPSSRPVCTTTISLSWL